MEKWAVLEEESEGISQRTPVQDPWTQIRVLGGQRKGGCELGAGGQRGEQMKYQKHHTKSTFKISPLKTTWPTHGQNQGG